MRVMGGVVLVWILTAQWTAAQQVLFTSPLVGVQDRFYEQVGVQWAVSWRGSTDQSFFNFGGPSTAVPPFGGFRANSAARFGFGTLGNGAGASLNFTAAQGNSRTVTSAASSVTVANGAIGSFQNATIRPFVTGLVPIVGARSMPLTLTSPLAGRIARLRHVGSVARPPAKSQTLRRRSSDRNSPSPQEWPVLRRRPSTADHGDISIAEIRKRQAVEDSAAAERLRELIDQAKHAEQNGHLGAARIRYERAARQARGDLKRQLLEKVASLRKSAV